VATSLPVLQVLDRVVFPEEGEEKYLFLPLVGFCILMGQLVNSKGGLPLKWQRFTWAAVILLAGIYAVGTQVNGDYFRDLGKRYEKTFAGLEREADCAGMDAVIGLIYGDNQIRREMMLASYLEYTFDFEDPRAWFFMERAQLLSVVDGRLPDLTLPKSIDKITTETGMNTIERGLLKRKDPHERLPKNLVQPSCTGAFHRVLKENWSVSAPWVAPWEARKNALGKASQNGPKKT